MTEHTKSPSPVPYTGELIHTLNEIVGVTLAGFRSAVIRAEQNVLEVPPTVIAEMEDDRG